MEARILTAEEIATLNRDGANLKSGNFYLTAFLINSQPNDAGDPRPFQILPEALDKFAKSAIGRPFVLGANGKKHVRPPSSFYTAEDLIKYQKQFAAGEIVHEYINPETGNANVIVQVFPEYIEDFKAGRIPPYVSPLIENSSADLLERNGRLLIQDGRILHLQAVDKPGYGEVATIHGTCEGKLGECMNELRALGASGKLKENQLQDKYLDAMRGEQFQESYSSQNDSTDKLSLETMSSNNVSTTLTAEEINKLVDARFAELQSKTLGASGTAAALEQESNPPPKPKDPPPTNEGELAAQTEKDIESHPKFIEVLNEVAVLKAAKQESDKKLALKTRTDEATAIVELEILEHEYLPVKRAEKIKALVESKDDLSLYAKKAHVRKAKILGASRGEIAQLHADTEEPIDYFAIHNSVGSPA